MSEINERESVSLDCPLSPASACNVDEAQNAGKDAYRTLAQFVRGEVQTSIDEYKVLQQMNESTALTYQDMHQVAHNVTKQLSDLNEKYETLRPYLRQIDEIESVSKDLETVVGVLEAYLSALEQRLKVAQLSSAV